MIVFQKLVLAIRAVGFINKVINFISAFNNDTPQTIKISCNIKLKEEVDKKIKKINSSHNTKDSKFNVLLNNIYLHYATWHRHKADIYWGRASQIERYKCAWFYVTSGELYEKANDLYNASNQYHFAANQFRDVGAFNQSIKYYIKSSIISSEENWKERNKARAISIARMAGEMETAQLLEQNQPEDALKLTR
jgi:hypothetical protein